MRILLIGSASVHLINYSKLMEAYIDEYKFISNNKIDIKNHETIIAPFTYHSFFKFIKSVRIIRNTLKSYDPDIIHVHQANIYALTACLANLKKTKPIMITAWGSDVLVLPQRSLLHRLILKYICSKADMMTGGSKHLINSLIPFWSKKKPSLILANFGINVIADDLKKEKIIFSNRLHEPIYRIERIINEFYKFNKTGFGRDWKLVIAGNGSLTQSLKDLVNKLEIGDQVEFVGWLNPLMNSHYYNKSLAYCSLPSSDSAAISVVESMACGCLPVVSDLSAMRELIKNNQNGIIVGSDESNIFDRLKNISFDKASSINRKIGNEIGDRQKNALKFLIGYKTLLNIK